MTRFDTLHRPGIVMVADKIAKLALAKSSVLYMTKWQIARTIGEDPQMVTLALRLAYTSEFLDLYGYGFVPPGNGRSGAIYGYVLLHTGMASSDDALISLHDGNAKRTDHVRAAAMHFDMLATSYGRKTPFGKKCRWLSKQLDAAVATAEQVQDESEKLLR